LSAFGVIIALLLSRATEYYQEFLKTGADEPHAAATHWSRLVRWTPLVVLAPLICLSWVGAWDTGITGTTSRQTALWLLLVVPLFAQIGFALLVWRLSPPVSPICTIELQDVPKDAPLPKSPMGNRPRTVVRFVNQTSDAVHIWWLDSDGHRKGLADETGERPTPIRPGDELPQHTFETHHFLVADKDDKAMGFIVAPRPPVKVLIHQ
jgi:hypothetical protein